MTEEKVVDFRKAAPSARLKALDWKDKRSRCEHYRVEIWQKEPILECADCGAVVDPHVWIRKTVGDWARVIERQKWEMNAAKIECDEIKQQLRMLRKEFANEAEKHKYDSCLMMLPPQNLVKIEQEPK